MKDMCDEPGKDGKSDRAGYQEIVTVQNEAVIEIAEVQLLSGDIALQQKDNDDDGVGKQAKEEPVEQAEPKASAPAFFSHRYESGKRTYKSFACNGCTKVVRVDKLKIKGTWKCFECVRPQSSVARDKHRHRKVSALG